MATATETTERESKLEELRRLEAESRGDWVKCICTEVDEDDLVFRFETIHGRTTTKNFDVPDTIVGSDVMAFFDGVGRHPENASLMEGDEFWMHMADRRIVDDVPSDLRRKIPPRSAFIPKFQYDVLPDVFAFVGGAMMMPLGVYYWYKWEQSPRGLDDPLFAMVIGAFLILMWSFAVLVLAAALF